MSIDRRRDIVLDAISNNDQIGFNELFRLLKGNSKTSMAKSTLHKVVDQLEEDKIIAKIYEEGKQNYHLTTDVNFAKSEKLTFKKIDKILSKHEGRLARLRHAAENDILDFADLITLTRLFAKSIAYLDWTFFSIRNDTEDEQLQKRLERLIELKKGLFIFASEQDLLFDNVVAIVNHDLTEYAKGAEMDFDADLESFEWEAKF